MSVIKALANPSFHRIVVRFQSAHFAGQKVLKLAAEDFFLIVGQGGVQVFKLLIDGRPLVGCCRIDRTGMERSKVVGYHSGKTPAGRGKFVQLIFGLT